MINTFLYQQKITEEQRTLTQSYRQDFSQNLGLMLIFFHIDFFFSYKLIFENKLILLYLDQKISWLRRNIFF